ncbi:hypothetical protein ZEAMMB73_Zm00001d038213 [Zea mays]|uniref:Uncharacterized protein n=1 Tax=Zea mays TaxID=4577 RepID=A0A1D6M4K1_MAIZE|nr:hypothetical protein ZEAMMB73_Zm00001d038213 [Zea mays]AQK86058.1 hypothetical protein ZEAMMB73_Zm00001d038213 [Zea mays]
MADSSRPSVNIICAGRLLGCSGLGCYPNKSNYNYHHVQSKNQFHFNQQKENINSLGNYFYSTHLILQEGDLVHGEKGEYYSRFLRRGAHGDVDAHADKDAQFITSARRRVKISWSMPLTPTSSTPSVELLQNSDHLDV